MWGTFAGTLGLMNVRDVLVNAALWVRQSSPSFTRLRQNFDVRGNFDDGAQNDYTHREKDRERERERERDGPRGPTSSLLLAAAAAAAAAAS